MARKHRKPTEFHEVNYWQSYSDMMAGVLLMFILIICGTLFTLMQVKNSYDARELALQEREDELEQAIIENLDYLDLTEAQNLLLDAQKSQLDEQQAALDEAQAQLDEQQQELLASQALLALQQTQLQDKENQIADQQTALATQQAQLEDIIGVKKDLIADLSSAFANTDLSISIDEQTGAITMDSSVMFDYNSSQLSDDGQTTLSEFLPEYFNVVLSDEYIDYVSEIIIEGHTDTVGTYEYNLELSQARAEAVAAYCLGDDQDLFSQDMLSRVRSLVSVGGRSWSSPIYNEDGTVDADASRRVEIKFRLSDEEMINELLDVLGQYE
jgi:chemotaxis protein MotB